MDKMKQEWMEISYSDCNGSITTVKREFHDSTNIDSALEFIEQALIAFGYHPDTVNKALGGN